MPRKLTRNAIDSLPTPKSDVIYWDMAGDRVKRREFITLLAGAAAWPLAARAQAAKVYRVAYLAYAGDQDAVIVKRRLNELGYSEGQNLIFDLRSAQGDEERLLKLAAELAGTNPDVIVAGFGTATAKAAQASTATIPIVFTSVGDPIASGIVKSLNRPGGNLTGLHAQATDIFGKRLQVLADIAPGIRTVAVLLERGSPFTAVALPELKRVADARGQQLKLCDAGTAEQLATGLNAAVKAGATALTILETPPLLAMRQEIVDLAAKFRLPSVYTNREFVSAGGLASYGVDRRQLYRRAAEFVDKILKGQQPAEIPVEQPTKFELVINLNTAKALGLTIPPVVLAIADDVIE
jgi:putative tryptophan/tyrosine transport system substrate-binding protein